MEHSQMSVLITEIEPIEQFKIDVAQVLSKFKATKGLMAEAVCKGSVEDMEILYQIGVRNMDSKYVNGFYSPYNAVEWAVKGNSPEKVQWLVEHGAKLQPNITLYVTFRDVEMIKLLLSYNIEKPALLAEAACEGTAQEMQKLYDIGIRDLNSKYDYGVCSLNAIEWAVYRGSPEKLNWLLEHGATLEQKIALLVNFKHLETIKILLSNQIHMPDLMGKAAYFGTVDDMKNLYSIGVRDLETKYRQFIDEHSPIEWSVYRGSPEKVQWLVEHGAKLEGSINNQTLLQFAIKNSPRTIVSRSGFEQTFYMNGFKRVAEYLRSLGCQ